MKVSKYIADAKQPSLPDGVSAPGAVVVLIENAGSIRVCFQRTQRWR